MTYIFDDKRPIHKIVYADRSFDIWTKGVNGVTEIEAYAENGEMAPVIWFKIWMGDHLYARVNGKHIETVYYGEKK